MKLVPEIAVQSGGGGSDGLATALVGRLLAPVVHKAESGVKLPAIAPVAPKNGQA